MIYVSYLYGILSFWEGFHAKCEFSSYPQFQFLQIFQDIAILININSFRNKYVNFREGFEVEGLFCSILF